MHVSLNGLYLLIAAAVIVIIALFISWLKSRAKKRAQLAYLNRQWERQNKDFTFSENLDDDVGPVRIRMLGDYDTSIFDGEEIDAIIEPVSLQPIAKMKPEAKKDWPNVICLYIKAKNHGFFYGYDLLQAILNHGLVHGSMQFFHYSDGQHTLFSLTSIKPPGGFNLDNMGAFKTSGLCLFLQPHRFSQPEKIFDLMVNTAQQISDDLGGTLEDEQHHLLTPERLNYWRSTLQEHEE